MAAREIYLRVVLVRDGVEYITGLELRPNDELGKLRTIIRVRMTNAAAGLMPGRWRDVAEEALAGSCLLHRGGSRSRWLDSDFPALGTPP